MNHSALLASKLGAMWKTSDGRYGWLAYVTLGMLALVVVAVIAYLTGTPGWDTRPRFKD